MRKVYTGRARGATREDEEDGYIEDPRGERARTRGECPAVCRRRVRAGWRFRRGKRVNVIGSVGDAGGGNGGGGRQRKGVPRGRRSPRVKEEPGKEIAAAREESKRDLNGRRGVSWEGERKMERRETRKRDRNSGESRRAPSTQGGSSLRELGWVCPLTLTLSPSVLTSRGFGRLVWGGDTVGAGSRIVSRPFHLDFRRNRTLISRSIRTLEINAGNAWRLMEIQIQCVALLRYSREGEF